MRKKLIEVALPLDAINVASAREKSIRHGHPSTLHLWWARRPLAAARAVIFAQMVDDPSEYVDVLLSDPKRKRAAQRALKQRRAAGAAAAGDVGAASSDSGDAGGQRPSGAVAGARSMGAGDRRALGETAAAFERERLFKILRELVRWENTANEKVLDSARTEIRTLDVLRQILGHAVRCGHLAGNPARGVTRNRRPRPTRFLLRAEVARLHAALDAHRGRRAGSGRQQADVIRLLLLTGCRKAEIVTFC